MVRPNIVNLELEDLPDGYNKTEEYILKLEEALFDIFCLPDNTEAHKIALKALQ